MTQKPYITEKEDGILLRLHIQPGASKTEFAGLHGERLKVRLRAPPVDGKANKELIGFLSKSFRLPKSGIQIIAGLTGRQKTVKLIGLSGRSFDSLCLPG